MLKDGVITSVEEMKQLAAEVAKGLLAGEILLLEGDLGSGKTTFTQGLAQALGVEGRVNSPSFTIVSEYEVVGGGEIKKMVHVDLYRLDDEQVVNEAAVREVLAAAPDLAGVTVVEWADKLGDISIENAKWIRFEHGEEDNVRKVTIE